jgi:hypothetical protein
MPRRFFDSEANRPASLQIRVTSCNSCEVSVGFLGIRHSFGFPSFVIRHSSPLYQELEHPENERRNRKHRNRPENDAVAAFHGFSDT